MNSFLSLIEEKINWKAAKEKQFVSIYLSPGKQTIVIKKVDEISSIWPRGYSRRYAQHSLHSVGKYSFYLRSSNDSVVSLNSHNKKRADLNSRTEFITLLMLERMRLTCCVLPLWRFAIWNVSFRLWYSRQKLTNLRMRFEQIEHHKDRKRLAKTYI